MRGEVAVAVRSKVNRAPVYCDHVLFVCTCALPQSNLHLTQQSFPHWSAQCVIRVAAAVTRAAGRVVAMRLEGLEAERPASTTIALRLAGVANIHRQVVSNGLDAVGHDRYRVHLGNIKLSHLP